MTAMTNSATLWGGGYVHGSPTSARPCNCIGPQTGAPVCPCMMPEHNRRKMADMALEIMTRGKIKPRIRVKAGRRVT